MSDIIKNNILQDFGFLVLGDQGTDKKNFDAQDTLADEKGNIVYSPQSMSAYFELINENLYNLTNTTPDELGMTGSITCGDKVIDIDNNQLTHPLFNRREQKTLYRSLLSDAQTIEDPKRELVAKYNIAKSLVAVGYRHMALQLIDELLDTMPETDIVKSFYIEIAGLQSRLGQKAKAKATVDLWLSELQTSTNTSEAIMVTRYLDSIEEANLRPQDEQAVHNTMVEWALRVLVGYRYQAETVARVARRMIDDQIALRSFAQSIELLIPNRYDDNLFTYTMIANWMIEKGFIDAGLHYYQEELDSLPVDHSFANIDDRSKRGLLIDGLCDSGLPVDIIEPYFRQAVLHDFYRSRDGLNMIENQIYNITTAENSSQERKLALLHILFEELLPNLKPYDQQRQMKKLISYAKYMDMNEEEIKEEFGID